MLLRAELQLEKRIKLLRPAHLERLPGHHRPGEDGQEHEDKDDRLAFDRGFVPHVKQIGLCEKIHRNVHLKSAVSGAYGAPLPRILYRRAPVRQIFRRHFEPKTPILFKQSHADTAREIPCKIRHSPVVEKTHSTHPCKPGQPPRGGSKSAPLVKLKIILRATSGPVGLATKTQSHQVRGDAGTVASASTSYQIPIRIGGCAQEHLLSRPAGTRSSTPSGGAGWGEEVHGSIPPDFIGNWYEVLADATVPASPLTW